MKSSSISEHIGHVLAAEYILAMTCLLLLVSLSADMACEGRVGGGDGKEGSRLAAHFPLSLYIA